MNATTGVITNAANLGTDWNSPASLNLDKGGPAPFSNLLRDAVGQVDALEGQAHTAALDLMSGRGVDVHQAVIAMQKADMAFELAISVRNKAVQAYQSVMGMQF